MIVHVGPNDPRIAPYAQVTDAAALRASGLFMAEGRLVVERLIASSRFAVHSILTTASALRAMGDGAGIDAPIYVAEPDVISRIAGIQFHRGCLALARRPEESPTAALDDARRILALEGIADPSNVGGLFRVAAAFGVDGLVLDAATADPFYRKALRTSMGAVLHLPFARLSPWPEALAPFKARGLRVLALTPRADARPIAEIAREHSGPLMVLAGAEGTGLSDGALAAADALVKIPTTALVDSLNVTVAAGIALQALNH